MDVLSATLALSRTPGLGPRRIKLLVEHFGSAQSVLAAAPNELAQVEGIGPALQGALAQAGGSSWPQQELERAAKLGLRLLALEDPAYPACLRAIYDPPPVLYLRGELPELGVSPRSIGIVGTRDASAYALALSKALAGKLAAAGVTVVSGLALGVDAAAHAGALQSPGGRTVAVLGSGVDVLYPRQNQGLAQRILDEGGAVVSEYPIGTRPRPSNFPARNRIISGLASGVVVVEAGRKSGALITADFALEEGRGVFAVPGRVGDPKAKGALELLKQGAQLLQDADDILQTFGWDRPAAPRARPELPREQQQVLEQVERLEAPLLDDLLQATGLEAHVLLPLLTRLELAGLVQVLPGGRYRSSPRM